MLAKREIWKYPEDAKVWVGKYRNSHNLLHWHYDCEFIYVEQGLLDVYCERRDHILRAGEAFFTDSGQMHYQRALAPDTVLVVFVFKSGILPFLEEYRLTDPKLHQSYPIPEFYGRLLRVLKERRKFYGEEARCILEELMIGVFRGEQIERRVKEDRTEAAFKELLEELQSHCERYRFQDAVRFMNMSEAYFSRYFKAMTGSTFTQYINYMRIDRAVQLLRSSSDLSMTEIAEQCGFETIRSFNRTFRELTGASPSRLPSDYFLKEQFSLTSEDAFDPTLYDCTLIESCDGESVG